ncbi:MAG TPA: hypothetical protein PKA63_08440 [Oligoflexia bacterium]|nr:hypothetical protein [Oligoflexia bacterium]HMP48678.1 hypothetical protein [Oligoflexia bacterium]
MAILRTLIRLFVLLAGVGIFVSIPIMIDSYSRNKLVPFLESDIEGWKIKLRDFSTTSTNFAFPLGLKLKSISGALFYNKDPETRKNKFFLSADSIATNFSFSQSWFEKVVPVEITIRGLILTPSVDEFLETPNIEGKIKTFTLDYFKLVLEHVTIPFNCQLSNFSDSKDIFKNIVNCLNDNWYTATQFEKVYFDIYINGHKFLIPIKDISKEEFLIGEVELEELSSYFRSPLSIKERSYIKESPLNGLLILKLREKAQRKAWEYFSDDLPNLDNYYVIYYHYMIAKELGPGASRALQQNEYDGLINRELEQEGLRASLGRLSYEKGISEDKFNDKEFIRNLISDVLEN